MDSDVELVEQMEASSGATANDSTISHFNSNEISNYSNRIESNYDSIINDGSGNEQVMHALSDDGTTLPLTLDPETGQYMTVDGLTVTMSMEVENGNVQELQQLTKTVRQTNQPIETQEEIDIAQDIHLDISEDSVKDHNVSMGETHTFTSQINSDLLQVKADQKSEKNEAVKIASKDLNSFTGGSVLRVLNPDGTMSDLSSVQSQQIRIVNSDGTLSSLPDSSNVRLLSSDGMMMQMKTTQEAESRLVTTHQPIRFHPSEGFIPSGSGISMKNPVSTQPVRVINTQDTQQIQVINTDGLSPGNFRIISSGAQLNASQSQDGPSKVRIVSALPRSPVKAISFAQAQQMGLLSAGGSRGALKILPKSPVGAKSPQKLPVGSTIHTTDGKTIIIGSPKKQQIILQPTNVPSAQPQQIIRLPAKVPASSDIQQINSGGKVQYIRVINSQASSMGPKTQLVTVKSGTPILPATAKSLTQGNMVKISLPPAQQLIRTISAGSSVSGSTKAQRAILPSPISTSSNETSQNSRILPHSETKVNNIIGVVPKLETKQENIEPAVLNTQAYEAFLSKKEEKPKLGQASVFEAPGVRPRKPCNCTKSQCLKLYCDCFANGEFCFNCNCTNCYNNLQHERQRQKSIKQCLDRNPSAFRPKIGKAVVDGERRHNKGCNCKRSGCLKNYCECYEAKIPCTESCKCVGCKNLEEVLEISAPSVKQELSVPTHSPASAMAPVNIAQNRKLQNLKSRLGPFASATSIKTVDGVTQLFSFVTTEVVDATCMCLMERANEAEKEALSETEIEGVIIEEFGRCLKQIIEMAKKSSTNTSNNHNSLDS